MKCNISDDTIQRCKIEKVNTMPDPYSCFNVLVLDGLASRSTLRHVVHYYARFRNIATAKISQISMLLLQGLYTHSALLRRSMAIILLGSTSEPNGRGPFPERVSQHYAIK